jgi:hypothetical protein
MAESIERDNRKLDSVDSVDVGFSKGVVQSQ